jgi:hypothetical protein
LRRKNVTDAALQAAREGSTTQVVAFADEPKNPAPREVMFSMHMAVGPDAFPPDVSKDLCAFADEIGVTRTGWPPPS